MSLIRRIFKSSRDDSDKKQNAAGSKQNVAGSKQNIFTDVNVELEIKLKKYLDYLMGKDKLESIVYDYHYLKNIYKLSQLLYSADKMQIYSFAIMEFTKVVEHIIMLLKLTRQCSCTAIIEYYGRKLTKNEKIHDGHNLDFCMRGNHIFYALVSMVTAMTDISRVFCDKFNDREGTNFIFDYLSNETFLTDSILHNYLQNKEKDNEHVLDLFKNCVAIVQNMSRTVKINKKTASNIMLSFAKNLNFQEEHSIISYMFLAKIMRAKGKYAYELLKCLSIDPKLQKNDFEHNKRFSKSFPKYQNVFASNLLISDKILATY